MAKYLKPRRGSKANAHAQNIGLQKGELFMEFPNGYIGKEPGRLVIGDGASSYHSISYATTSTNVFQPFITDPSIYIPRFTNTSTSTGSGSVNSGMTSIEKMGDGSSASTTNLPTIVSAIKEALVYHANSITKLNNDLTVDGFTMNTMEDGSTYTYIYPGRVEVSNSLGRGVEITNNLSDDIVPGINIFMGDYKMIMKPSDIVLSVKSGHWGNTDEYSLNGALSYIPTSGKIIRNTTTYHYIRFPSNKYAIIWYKHNGSMSGVSYKQFEIKIPFTLIDPVVSINGGITDTRDSVVAYTQLDSGSTVGQYYLIDQSGSTASRNTWAYITVYGRYA